MHHHHQYFHSSGGGRRGSGAAPAASAPGPGGTGGGSSSSSNNNPAPHMMSARHKAALASAYQELSKELLASSQLKTVGNYTLGRPIAEGTFGKVRLGTHRLTNTRVAIKQIPKTMHSSHSSTAAALTREIHHHRRLHHPHVIQLYEVLATESSIWMVSELCAGGELYDYLVERGTLPDAEARRIFGQLCLAVAYIHERGIVHRDLKLENVLLDELCNVKLGDFGFTREFERRKLMDTFCGTTGYAAPEMLAGKKYTGQEVDIWSLGIILYALLTGSLPFDDDDEDVMRLKILQGDYELPDDLSEDARNLIRSILKQNPLERLGIRAILAHPWFTRPPMPPPLLAHTSSFGASGPESADHAGSSSNVNSTGNYPPSSYRHPLNAAAGSSSAPASDAGSEIFRERERESEGGRDSRELQRERERHHRPASRTAGGPISDLPPTTEADNESNTSVSLPDAEEVGALSGADEDAALDSASSRIAPEGDSDAPVVGVHSDQSTEGESATKSDALPRSSSSAPESPIASSSLQILHQQTVSTISDLSFVSATSGSVGGEDEGSLLSLSAPSSSLGGGTSSRSESSTNPTTEEGEDDRLSKELASSAPGGTEVDASGVSTKEAKDAAVSVGLSEGEAEVEDRQRLRSIRNESQTTIRRKDSMGSDQSRRASGNLSLGGAGSSGAGGAVGGGMGAAGSGAGGVGSAPLPTHHESPNSSIDDPQDVTVTTSDPAASSGPAAATSSTAAVPLPVSTTSTSAQQAGPGPEGASLMKCNSQNSSMSLQTVPGASGTGHFRTPSRTKRRSASSIALSTEGILPPRDASASPSSTRFVDYVSLLTQLQPALFSTTAEQRLLVQLSTMGMDVGQIVHSVTTDACDASGALWWLLKKKAEERERERESEAIAAGLVPPSELTEESVQPARAPSPPLPPTPSTAPVMVPPPIPPKDPARQRSNSEAARATAAAALLAGGALRPDDGLPKAAQDSFREHLSRLPAGGAGGASGTAAMAVLRQLERERSLAAVSGTAGAGAGLPISQSEPAMGVSPSKGGATGAVSDASAPASAAASRPAAGRASFSATEVPTPTTHASRSPLRKQVVPDTPTQQAPPSPSPSAPAAGGNTSLGGTSGVSSSSSAGGTPTKTGRGKRNNDRQRTNSLSIRTFASALAGGKNASAATAADVPHQTESEGGHGQPERAKSPVSALFLRRGPGSLIGKPGGGRNKEAERGALTSSGGGAGGAGSPILSKGPTPDPFRPGAQPASILAVGNAALSPAATTSTTSLASPIKKGDADKGPLTPASVSGSASTTTFAALSPKKSMTSVKHGQLHASLSQDTFSTVQSQTEGANEKGRSKEGTRSAGASAVAGEKPRRPKSSFLSTVRTWLNADERHAKKRKQKQAAAALLHGHGHGASQHAPSVRGTAALTAANGGGGTHSRNNSASLSGSAARTGSVRAARQNPYPPVSPTVRRSLVGPPVTNSSQRGSISRRSSTGSTVLPGIGPGVPPPPPPPPSSSAIVMSLANTFEQLGNRPMNLRRQSAGSITPTATLYGEYAPESTGLFVGPARGSRPSSMHSFSQQQLHPRRLPAKTGSMSSASSLRRPHDVAMAKSGSNSGSFHGGGGSYNGNSLKSIHARRLSADGGTIVRRQKSGYGLGVGAKPSHGTRHHHRTGSGHSRASSPGPSMLGEIARGEDNESEAGPSRSPTRARGPSGMNSNRSSTYEGDLLTVPAQHGGAGSGSQDEQSEVLKSGSNSLHGSTSHPTHHPTLFVAHKSRSPYKPPSANHALQGMIHRAAAASQQQQQQQQQQQLQQQQASSVWEPRTVPLGTWHRSWGRPPPGWTGPVDETPLPSKPANTSQQNVRDVFARPRKRTKDDLLLLDNDDDDAWVDEEEEPAYSGGLGQLDSSKASGFWVSAGSAGATGLGVAGAGSLLPSHLSGASGSGSNHLTLFGSGVSGGSAASRAAGGLPGSSSALHPALGSPVPGRGGFRQFDGFMPRSGGAGQYPAYLSRGGHAPAGFPHSAYQSQSQHQLPLNQHGSASGLRGLFAPPSLGSDVYPRTTIIPDSVSAPALVGGSLANGSGLGASGAGPAASASAASVTEGKDAQGDARLSQTTGAAGATDGANAGSEAGGPTSPPLSAGADGPVSSTSGASGPTPHAAGAGMSGGGAGPRRAAAAAASAFVSIEEGEEEED
ncbi:hypothetical protein OC844_001084 [Tilletia horrida]|nr:hypothetical protein OC844_001084 [Tilletia horrida]